MAVRRATSPDGREWEVHVRRFRMPPWRDDLYEGEEEDHLVAIAWNFVAGLLFWFLVPLAIAIVEVPAAFVRSLFSEARWVEARCADPSELTILWRTTRPMADAIAEHVASRRALGYEDLTPPRAELVEAPTRPDD